MFRAEVRFVEEAVGEDGRVISIVRRVFGREEKGKREKSLNRGCRMSRIMKFCICYKGSYLEYVENDFMI